MNIIDEPKKRIIEELIIIYKKKEYFLLVKKIQYFKRIYPNSIFLINLLGNTYVALKKYSEAIQCFKLIIKSNPKFADAHYNLGIIYKILNNNNYSIIHYNSCIHLNPKKFEAYNNLGNIYKNQYKIGLAIQNYLRCLEINPNYTIALKNFGVCLQNYRFSKTSDLIEKQIINLLEHNRIIRPVDINQSIISYLYLNSKFKAFIKNLEKYNLIEELVLEISNNKILMSLLKITPITDLKIEKILRTLRSRILLNISSIRNRHVVFTFMNSLAQQCFINEYLYPISIDENKEIKKIEQRILQTKENKNLQKFSLEISCLAAYKSLNLYSFSKRIHKIRDLVDLIDQQINEPEKEINLKKNIITFKIKDKISLNVKNQYEANPYPRWNKIALYDIPKKLETFFTNIEINIDKKKISSWNKLNVLVAGCGTGQHALTTSTKYKNSNITAIDLSKKSLSYAKRKADELKIKNIEFIEIDLLDIKKIKRKFNIIESVGVLHHMQDPFLGWRTLYESLEPHGLMMIGLYSKIARQHIQRIRNDIKKRKIESIQKNIINYREKIISSDTDDHVILKKSSDFYSVSTLRDLIFHTQEYTFTIPEIEKFIKSLKLEFCGFENKEIVNLFKKVNKYPEDLYNLNLWGEFENNNPRIFAGMYQFWCQKK